jgi:hypothetical protein
MRMTSIENGHRIQLPADWAAELGLEKVVELEKTSQGILVRSCPAMTWKDIFDHKLPMGKVPSTLDLSEVSGDDLLF